MHQVETQFETLDAKPAEAAQDAEPAECSELPQWIAELDDAAVEKLLAEKSARRAAREAKRVTAAEIQAATEHLELLKVWAEEVKVECGLGHCGRKLRYEPVCPPGDPKDWRQVKHKVITRSGRSKSFWFFHTKQEVGDEAVFKLQAHSLCMRSACERFGVFPVPRPPFLHTLC